MTDILSQQKPQASTVVTTPSTQAFGDAAAIGTATDYANGSHKHAMPANPIARMGATASVNGSMTLPAAPMFAVFPITGTNTITDIDAGTAGQIALLEFASAGCAVTNGNHLTLQGNYSSVAKGVLGLTYDGTNWIEIARNTQSQFFATPSIALGSAPSAGSTNSPIRMDSTIAAFDTTAPTTQAFGDAAAVGTAAFATRRDHKHAMMANPVTAHDVAAAIHGLAANVNVLGNRAGAGYFVQMGSNNTGSESTVGSPTIYFASVSVTFAAAFPTACDVVLCIPGGGVDGWATVSSKSATGFVGLIESTNTGVGTKALLWLAVGH